MAQSPASHSYSSVLETPTVTLPDPRRRWVEIARFPSIRCVRRLSSVIFCSFVYLVGSAALARGSLFERSLVRELYVPLLRNSSMLQNISSLGMAGSRVTQLQHIHTHQLHSNIACIHGLALSFGLQSHAHSTIRQCAFVKFNVEIQFLTKWQLLRINLPKSGHEQ